VVEAHIQALRSQMSAALLTEAVFYSKPGGEIRFADSH
jgi:hypothetical protein